VQLPSSRLVLTAVAAFACAALAGPYVLRTMPAGARSTEARDTASSSSRPHSPVARPRGPPVRSSKVPEKAPVATDHPPVDSGIKPDVWSEAEIVAALRECEELLVPLGAEVELSKPIRNGQCGTPAPILLRRAAGVEISPPAVVNCRLAARLHAWIEGRLQPAAQATMHSPISRIITSSAYACRQRIGTTNDRLSEHSFANALDVSAFVTADGRTIDVLTHWGRTLRDLHAEAQSQGATSMAGGDARPLMRDTEHEPVSPERQFLHRAHQEACGIFATVLGPEANEAHRNHLHLDLATRRHNAFCQ
jgi:hypothetical protein